MWFKNSKMVRRGGFTEDERSRRKRMSKRRVRIERGRFHKVHNH